MEMTCVAGVWFSWEGDEGGRGKITEASERLMEKCGHYPIADGKPQRIVSELDVTRSQPISFFLFLLHKRKKKKRAYF